MGGLAFGLVVLPTVAHAQRTNGDDPAFETATSVLGAVLQGYHLEASMRTTYDDNILRVGDGLQPRSGRSKGDFRFAPAVSAGVAYPLGRQLVTLDATIGRDIYARNTQKNRNRYSITAGAAWRLANRCSGSLNADYRRRQNLLSELSEFTDNVQVTQSYAASANCQVAGRFGVGGSVTRNEVDNKNPNRQLFDSRTTSYSGNVSYGSATLGSLSLGGGLSQIDYPSRPVLLPTGATETDGLKLYRGFVGYNRTFGPRFNVALSGSYLNAKPQPGTIVLFADFGPPGGPPNILPIVQPRQGFKGAGYSASVTYRPGSRLSADLSASRQVSSSSSVGALFVINERYGLDVGYKLGPSITTGLGATFDKRRYRDGFASVEEIVARRSDNTSRFYGRVGYAPTRLYDVDLEVGHQRRKSNPSIFSVSSTSVALSLRVKFGRS